MSILKLTGQSLKRIEMLGLPLQTSTMPNPTARLSRQALGTSSPRSSIIDCTESYHHTFFVPRNSATHESSIVTFGMTSGALNWHIAPPSQPITTDRATTQIAY